MALVEANSEVSAAKGAKVAPEEALFQYRSPLSYIRLGLTDLVWLSLSTQLSPSAVVGLWSRPHGFHALFHGVASFLWEYVVFDSKTIRNCPNSDSIGVSVFSETEIGQVG